MIFRMLPKETIRAHVKLTFFVSNFVTVKHFGTQGIDCRHYKKINEIGFEFVYNSYYFPNLTALEYYLFPKLKKYLSADQDK